MRHTRTFFGWGLALLGVWLVPAATGLAGDDDDKSAIHFVDEPSGKGRYEPMTREDFRKYCGYLCKREEPLKLTKPDDEAAVKEDFDKWYKDQWKPCVEAYLEHYKEGVTTVGVANHLGGTGPDPLAWWPKNLLIRRTYEEQAIRQAKPFDKAQGAIFSFTRDFEGKSDTWEARGAAMLPIKLIDPDDDDSPQIPWIDSFYIMPSLSFDRVANEADESKEVDSLVGRFAAELGGPILDLNPEFFFQYVRADIAYASDFDLESGVVGAEFEWEPIWTKGGLGMIQRVRWFPFFEYRARAILHAEFGRVTAVGKKASLIKNDDFFRYGPKFQLELFPTPYVLAGLSFIVKYEYLEGSSGEPGHSDLFEAGMSWKLDPKERIGLDLTYRVGEIALTKEEVDSLTIGLSVKF